MIQCIYFNNTGVKFFTTIIKDTDIFYASSFLHISKNYINQSMC